MSRATWTIVAVLALALPVSALPQEAEGGAGRPEAGPQRLEMTVLGLSCPFCAYGLEKKLKKIEGLTALDIDFKSGRVELKAEDGSKASDERIRKLVGEAGLKVEGEIRRSPLSGEATGKTGE